MTYEERQRYQQLREDVDALRERLQAKDADEPLSREEGLALLDLVDSAIDRMSPQRWDKALDAVAREAARRASSSAGPPGRFGG